MKISKKTCNSSNDINIQSVNGSDCLDLRQPGIDAIMSAIECLSKIANNDEIAKHAICDLSVVLFDLKTV